MIRGITPGDGYEAPLKTAGPLRGESEEKGAPEPADSAEITIPTGKSVTAQDMRKASIDYYHLHKKRKEAPGSYSKARSKAPGTTNKSGSSAPKTITLFGAESSVTDIISPMENSAIDIKQFDRKLETELGTLAKAQNTWDLQGLDGEIPSLSKLQDSFEKIKMDKSVPWEYIIDGCYARAHVTCEKLLNEGLNCGKMYVMIGDTPGDPWSPFPEYRLKSENKFMKAEWWYHVAPLVFAKDDKTGQVEGYILDLAVNNKNPIKASEWINSCWSRDFPIQFDTTHADIYEPPEQSPEGDTQQFSRKRFDQYLPEARGTDKEYSRVLAKIKKDYYAHHPDEKPEDKKRV